MERVSLGSRGRPPANQYGTARHSFRLESPFVHSRELPPLPPSPPLPPPPDIINRTTAPPSFERPSTAAAASQPGSTSALFALSCCAHAYRGTAQLTARNSIFTCPLPRRLPLLLPPLLLLLLLLRLTLKLDGSLSSSTSVRCPMNPQRK